MERPKQALGRESAQDQTAQALDAAYACVQHLSDQADGSHMSAPYWYGWALREAFLAGVRWQQENIEQANQAMRADDELAREQPYGCQAIGCPALIRARIVFCQQHWRLIYPDSLRPASPRLCAGDGWPGAVV